MCQILHVLGPEIFYGGPPEILDLHYKLEDPSNHCAKVCGNRPMELADILAN